MKKLLLLIFLIPNFATAQNPIPSKGELFKDDVVPRIDITVAASDLTFMYNNIYSDVEHPATFVFDNGTVKDTVQNVGFRLRGNTSRNAQKKSFKVSFNTFTTGGKYRGVEKLNLNGEHNDPSILRSKIAWELLRKIGIPAPRANHVEVYVNGAYYGLYINVEHIDDEFVQNRFGNDDGNLYKCTWPADLNYLGADPNAYKQEMWGKRTYELQTNKATDDYSDLANFITILTQEPLSSLPCELEKIFNVDAYLKVMAFDVLTSNWDGPIWNKNNFYLYNNPKTGKFEYIPFDLDNTFGVSWFPHIDWTNRNLYTWSHDSESRPIYERILMVSKYRDQYSYYLNDMLQTVWNTSTWFSEIDNIKTLITPSAIADNYRTLDYGLSVNDFNNALTQSVANHVPHGIKTFITARQNSALNQLALNDIYPIISEINTRITIDKEMIFRCKVFDDNGNLTVKAKYAEDGTTFQDLILYDDGMHNDEAANDGIYGNEILPTITDGRITYYFSATDNQLQTTYYPCSDDLSITYNTNLPKLVINEFMASNETTETDESGAYEDWIELYNADNIAIDLGDKFLTDNFEIPNKWQLPDVTLQPDEYLIIWADNDDEEGENHTNFKLSKGGEEIGIFLDESTGFTPIDHITYPAQTTDISYGRIPNGTGDFQVMDSVTFNRMNDGGVIIIVEPPVTELYLYPNPITKQLTIEHPWDENPTLFIYNTLGQKVYSQTNLPPLSTWNGIDDKGQPLSNGVYVLVFIIPTEDRVEITEKRKVVIFK